MYSLNSSVSMHLYPCSMTRFAEQHISLSYHTYESCHRYERVMLHLWTSHVTHTNVHIRMSHATPAKEYQLSHLYCPCSINDSCQTRIAIWMSHVTHVNKSCYTYILVISYLRENIGYRICSALVTSSQDSQTPQYPHLQLCTHTHIYIYIYIYMYICTYTHMYVHVYICIIKHRSVRTYNCVNTHIYTHTYIYIYIHIYIYMYMYIYICIYTCMYTCIWV